MKYRILKVLNNSTILLDDNGKQKIGIGNGIGFSKKPGDFVDSTKVEKLFENTDNKFIKKMTESIRKIDEKYYFVVDKIVQYANKMLNQQMPDSIYITLADHLYFAKERLEKGIVVPCPMKTEIKILYNKEFNVAEKAIEIVNKELNTNFDSEEAGLIALHIINVTINNSGNTQISSVSTVSEIVKIIEDYFGIVLDKNSLSYSRLLTHLHFLSLRMFEQDEKPLFVPVVSIDSSLNKARCCAQTIGNYIKENYNYKLASNELVYLAVHIQNCIVNA